MTIVRLMTGPSGLSAQPQSISWLTDAMATIAPEYVSLLSSKALQTPPGPCKFRNMQMLHVEAAAAAFKTSKCFYISACCMQGNRGNTVYAPLLLSPAL
jgi:hypothetical protein